MSLQLDRYLQERANGLAVLAAADRAGLSETEALLTEKAIERGELPVPHVRAPAPAREDHQQQRNGTMSNGNVAADELRLLVERIERLDEEIKGLNDDKRDVFAEAKSSGFDTKAMKQVLKLRKMEPHARAEAEAILETYLSALGMAVEPSVALAA